MIRATLFAALVTLTLAHLTLTTALALPQLLAQVEQMKGM